MSLLKRLVALITDFFPSRLPTTPEQFDSWQNSIFETYGFPEKPGYRHALANMIMHLDPTVSHKPKRFFAQSIRKAQANEVAFNVIQVIREQDRKDAAEKTQTEVQPALSNGVAH